MVDKKHTILVVDDDQALREMYKARLEVSGFSVIEGSNGEEAMARAVESHPDCILLDVMMPRVNGFDVLDILKTTAQTKEIPVIILTALMQDDARARVEKAGAAACLIKSESTPSEVVEVIVKTLHKKPQAAESAETPSA